MFNTRTRIFQNFETEPESEPEPGSGSRGCEIQLWYNYNSH